MQEKIESKMQEERLKYTQRQEKIELTQRKFDNFTANDDDKIDHLEINTENTVNYIISNSYSQFYYYYDF